MTGALTHLDAEGRARMIDVGAKVPTRREALARGRLVTTPEVVGLLLADGLPKADALATARIAGIAGAKRTSDLIPLCHPLPLDAVSVDLRPDGDTVVVEARVSTTGRTGVEMEALTAVSIAGLTLHDMVKAVDPGATMTDVQLIEKTGGKHGRWTRDQVVPVPETARAGGGRVLVVSTGAAAGTRTDTTGAVIADWLRSQGLATPDPVVVADADVAAGLRSALQDGPS
jgi:cyclic pyranopterin phosphate synthase